MIINSPVGRFPFEVTSISARGTTLIVHGQMGTWPTSVEVVPADLPALARRAGPVLGLLAGAAACGLAWSARRRR
jgi:hypothetical protein